MTVPQFFEKNLVYSTEFSKYILDHPEVGSKIPNGATVFFLVDDDPELTQKSLQMAKQQKKKGQPIVLIRVKGLRAESSRLIEPHVEKTVV